MPAKSREVRKSRPPLSAHAHEQTVSEANNIAPSRYTLPDAVHFTGSPLASGILPAHLPTPQARRRCVEPSPEPDASPLPGEADPRTRRRHKTDRRVPPKAH